jgi:hypothetical protein
MSRNGHANLGIEAHFADEPEFDGFETKLPMEAEHGQLYLVEWSFYNRALSGV